MGDKMISLLIVDDEKLEIEGLKATLDLHPLGIGIVYEAMNIRQAKEILSANPVDIMLCDIEMPQGSGMDLLVWVNEFHPSVQSIFITCHVDFCYAKKAIQLGSLDYLLKPAQPDELERAIRKAIDNIHKTSELINNSRFSKLWLKHRPVIIEHFWLNIIKNKTPQSIEDIKGAAAEINFPGLESMKVFPVLIRVQRWSHELNSADEKLRETKLRASAEEFILREPGNGIIIDLEDGGILALIYLADSEHVDRDLLKHNCTAYINTYKQYMDCELSCYIGCEVFINELGSVVDKLLLTDSNNASHSGRVLALCSKTEKNPSILLPDMSSWNLMLEEGKKEKLLVEIEQSMESLVAKTELNSNVLYQIQQDFVQLMILFLHGKGIQARQLMSDDRSAERFSKATRSVRNLIHWMEKDIERALEFVNEAEKSESVIDKVKRHIAQNIENELTCEEIAATVFLNPIYLTRIFKRETGVGVSEYLQQERVRIAKELLAGTNMPVNIVAAKVGYSNFSHFSRMFRKHCGMSPIDFRKHIMIGDNKPYFVNTK